MIAARWRLSLSLSADSPLLAFVGDDVRR